MEIPLARKPRRLDPRTRLLALSGLICPLSPPGRANGRYRREHRATSSCRGEDVHLMSGLGLCLHTPRGNEPEENEKKNNFLEPLGPGTGLEKRRLSTWTSVSLLSLRQRPVVLPKPLSPSSLVAAVGHPCRRGRVTSSYQCL